MREIIGWARPLKPHAIMAKPTTAPSRGCQRSNQLISDDGRRGELLDIRDDPLVCGNKAALNSTWLRSDHIALPRSAGGVF